MIPKITKGDVAGHEESKQGRRIEKLIIITIRWKEAKDDKRERQTTLATEKQ